MTHVVIAFHSGYGHTARQAQAVLDGALSNPGTTGRLLAVDKIVDADWDELKGADAIVFGSPTYMGGVSAPFKTFMDASSKPWYTRDWQNKVAGGFTTSASQSGDKLNTLIQLMVYANQHGMIWAGVNILPGNNSSTGSVDDLNRLGSFSGAMAQANADQGAEAMRDSDLETAKQYGKRIAEVATKLRA
ncbi:MAG TPA: flavodoxin family protein [Rhodocyclaceae bacterium]|jgi:multimeric flavodoxin WrbA